MNGILKIRPMLVFAMLVFFLLASCDGDSEQPSEPVSDANLTPDCFTASSSSPILQSGDLMVGATWSDPHVIKAGGSYYMYISSDNNFDQNIKIYRLTSTDGINWSLDPATAVFEKSASGWDKNSVETSAVVFFENKYHLFYTGYPITLTDSLSYKIGHATSTDGVTWTRDASYILAPTDPYNTVPNLDFNQWIVAEPGPVVFDGKIYLYFTAIGANAALGTTLSVIGLTTSSDGINWSTPQSVLEPDQTQYPRGSNYYGYSTPHATVINNRVHLFFDVVEESPYTQVKLHHAVSPDGVGEWTQDSKAIFDHSEFSWTATQILAPAVYLEGSTLNLWFGGHTGLTLGIGHATCPL